MWIWTSSALLATLLVSGLSFPHPDDHEYKIPTVGTGQRSQYYVLHKDGTYKYGFDTGDGAFESVQSHTLGSLEGKFGYVDPDGNVIKLEYESGRGGFVARGDHLPKPSPELAQALAAVVRRTEPFVDPLAGGDSDASYGFKFQSEDHSRTEEADSDGTVTGSYSYTDENGVLRRFTYKAGKGIGFVIEGDGLTVPIEAPSPKTNLPSRTITPAFKQSTSFSGNQATIHSTRSETPGSAAYSFSYDADDHSRREVSDDDLNIEGSFSFVADDGQRRTLNYEAGSNTGFVARGEHLPVAPAFDFGNRLSHGTRSSQAQRTSVKPSQYKASIKTNDRTGFSPAHGQRSSQSVHQTKTKQSVSQNAGISGHGSQTSSSSRQRGTGTSQTSVQHKASVTGTSASYSPSSQKIGQQTLTRTSQTVPSRTVTTTKDKITSSDAKTRQQTTSQRQSSSAVGVSQSHKFPSPSFKSTPTNRQYEPANVRSSSSPDGSYSFSYDTSSHSRSESGDAKNNVNGEFKFIASDDGEERKIVYEAGSATGFIAEGKHIPIGPIVPGSPSGQPTGRIVPVVQVPFVDPLADSDTDASYNFKFDSETYSRSETADEDGNIVGTYTVVDDDGTRVTYRFRAGKGIGYETEEISRTQGPKPVKPTPYSGPLAFETPATQTNQGPSSFTHSFTTGSGTKHETSFGIKRVDQHPSVSSAVQSGLETKSSGSVTKSSSAGPVSSVARKTSQQTYSSGGTNSGTRSTSSGSSSRTSQSSSTTSHQDSSKSTAYKSGSQTSSKLSGASTATTRTGTTGHFIPSKVDLKSAFHPSHTQQVFPGFKLFSYAPSPSAEKFGYVLKFDN